jgi:hypothetical protein
MNFNIEYFDVIPPQKYIYSSKRSDTSDETKKLELRLHKRDVTLNQNLDPHIFARQDKKLRLMFESFLLNIFVLQILLTLNITN